MNVPLRKHRFTEDEYLILERGAEDRHVFLDGEIFGMAGESLAHGLITVNLVSSVHSQLRGKPCFALTKDTKVRSGPVGPARPTTKGMYSYPDIVVVCGEPAHRDEHKDVILNPTAIIEALSPTTEAFDRGEKFVRYQLWNPMLTDYVLVSQDMPQVEHFSRKADGGWDYHLHVGLDAVVAVTTIGCTLKLGDVYDRVTFPNDQSTLEDTVP